MAGKARTDRTLLRAREAFLAALAGGASITRSCEAASIGHSNALSSRSR